MGYVEVEQFSLADGVTTEEFRRCDAELQAWSYVHRAGLVRRTTARDGDGGVLVVTLFSGSAEPLAVAGDALRAAPVATFGSSIDPGTYRRAVFRDLD